MLLSVFFSNAQIKADDLNLMPWPQTVNLEQGKFSLTNNFKINITGNPNKRIYAGVTDFLRRLDNKTGLFLTNTYSTKLEEYPQAAVEINCLRPGKVGLNEDESYQLIIDENKVKIIAATDLGALHGLETFYQLLSNSSNSFYFPCITINDAPRFIWRGLMIDAARHFQPIDVILRNLDGMAAMKMNVFHWHLSDDQGWRIQLNKHPKLTQLASDGLFYTQEQIRMVVNYADNLGIMVVPEIDIPGHTTAILSVYPELGSKQPQSSNYVLGRRSGVYDAALDPTNPKTYQFLDEVFDEVCELFPSAYFHIGGDENNGKEWNANPAIQDFKKKNDIRSNRDLQTYFNMKLLPMLKKHNKQMMGWEEILTENMSKEAIIHVWRSVKEGQEADGALIKAVRNGYKAVLSNGYYIDLMLSVDSHYLNDPIPKNVILSKEERDRILGGEATMWSELVTPLTIDSRIWPRTAVIAERLWSNDTVTDLVNMHRRLNVISNELEQIGLTHIRNKAVILRKLVNYQDIAALEQLSNLCEPLKRYARNGGGKKYFMYSPLSLFADACTADASDAYDFEIAVNKYVSVKSETNKKIILSYFRKWIQMHDDLLKLSKIAPLIQPLLPLSESLSLVSKEFLEVMANKKQFDQVKMNDLLESCNSKKNADVELAVYNSLVMISKQL
jgi:hexosaminidase